jgi:nucleoside-diphosphate-sugar epimerase
MIELCVIKKIKMMNTTDQQSKIVLVTGGSRGIGKSIALNAAKRGLGVILTYNWKFRAYPRFHPNSFFKVGGLRT